MFLSSNMRGRKRRAGSLIVPLSFLNVFALLVFSSFGHARTKSQEQQKEALGSLTAAGEVFVNDAAAPVESTIFAGDRVRTGESGTATFSTSGKGTLKIAPRSEVVFVGDYRFTADFKNGTVVLTSISEPSGVTLRVDNYVLISSMRHQSATTKVDRDATGSFRVSCLDGSVGVLTLEGKSGQFLPVGQSLTITSGRVIAPLSAPAPSAVGNTLHSGWLYLGLGGAGVAGLVAAMGHSSGKQAVSPSTP